MHGIFSRGRLRDRTGCARSGLRKREEGRMEDRPVSPRASPSRLRKRNDSTIFLPRSRYIKRMRTSGSRAASPGPAQDDGSRSQEMDVRRGRRRIQGGRGDQRGGQMPPVLPYRHGGGVDRAYAHGTQERFEGEAIDDPTMVKLKIDGKEIETRRGRDDPGSGQGRRHIHPTLCFHENLLPIGSCRLCVVEVEGYREPDGLVHTAATPAWWSGRNRRGFFRCGRTI